MIPSKRVLIVDDELSVRQLLSTALEAEGFETSQAGCGSDVWHHISNEQFDLITLDLNLADEDGIELAREIRARQNVPIIIISSRSHPIDRAVGLEAGADDYIVKPFHVRELLARVRLLLERYSIGSRHFVTPHGRETDAVKYQLNGWVVDTKRRELWLRDGTRKILTAAEFDLLQLFLEHPNRVISRDEIVHALYNQDWSPYDRRADTLVSRLRSQIEKDSKHPSLIKTVRGIGYVLAADVKQVSFVEQASDGVGSSKVRQNT